MADDDYPSNFPGATAPDPKASSDPHADPYPSVPADPPADPPTAKPKSIEEQETDVLNAESGYIKSIQTRDAQIDMQVDPYRQALLKEMAQPLPQMPSMSEASPYGPPPSQDPQTQRGGILSGLMYGLIGLGLAKIFAGRNKSAYYGALDGIGEALRQRNAGQQEQADKSFDRWVKLNQLWHQQLRDRVDDYKTAIENRKFSEQQKLEILSTIANMHGNTQMEAAARTGQMELFHQQLDHLDKMRIAQEKQADKIKENWVKQKGNTDLDRAYDNFLRGHRINPDNRAESEAAQQTQGQGDKDVSYYTFWQKNRQKPAPGTADKAAEEEKTKSKEEHLDQIYGPVKPAGAPTSSRAPAAYPSTEDSTGMLPS